MPPPPPPPKKITVGSLTLKYCNSDYDGYCGQLKRPLDPTGGIKGTITIGFEYYPRFDQSTPARGTLAAAGRRPGIFHDRHARRVSQYLRRAARAPRRADDRQARHRHFRRHRLPRDPDRRSERSRGAEGVRRSARREGLSLRHASRRRRHRRRARCAADRRGRFLRRQLRHVRRADVRGVASGAPAQPDSRQRVSRAPVGHLVPDRLDDGTRRARSRVRALALVSRAARHGHGSHRAVAARAAGQADQRHRAGCGRHSARRDRRCLDAVPVDHEPRQLADHLSRSRRRGARVVRQSRQVAAAAARRRIQHAVRHRRRGLQLRPVPGRDLPGISVALRPGRFAGEAPQAIRARHRGCAAEPSRSVCAVLDR